MKPARSDKYPLKTATRLFRWLAPLFLLLGVFQIVAAFNFGSGRAKTDWVYFGMGVVDIFIAAVYWWIQRRNKRRLERG